MNSYTMDGDVSYQFKAISMKILLAMCVCMCVYCQANSKISTEKKEQRITAALNNKVREHILFYIKP